MHTRHKSTHVGTRYLCSPVLLHNPVKERRLDMGLTASQAQDPPLKKFLLYFKETIGADINSRRNFSLQPKSQSYLAITVLLSCR